MGALLLVLLIAACSSEHYLVGDSYLVRMEPYWELYTSCPTHNLTQGGRLAALVLLEDVDEIAARVALLDDHVTPIVFMSAGLVDQWVAGPELAGIIVTRLAERLLAIRPDLELYHLDYRAEDPPSAYEDHPRWHRVTFEGLVTGELSPDGTHLRTSRGV